MNGSIFGLQTKTGEEKRREEKRKSSTYQSNPISLFHRTMPRTHKCSTQTCQVATLDGIALATQIFKPLGDGRDDILVVLVHQYSLLGGCQILMKGIARQLALLGFTTVTFDMRGVGGSTGRSSLTGSSEIRDVLAVCKWASRTFSANQILLVGSSAGAPIAGSAVDQIEQVIGYVGLGYPFGLTASILFGRHHRAILQSPKPKLFVMGTSDGFTSVKRLKSKLSKATGPVKTHLIEGVGHFQMEGPAFDSKMADLITGFIDSL